MNPGIPSEIVSPAPRGSGSRATTPVTVDTRNAQVAGVHASGHWVLSYAPGGAILQTYARITTYLIASRAVPGFFGTCRDRLQMGGRERCRSLQRPAESAGASRRSGRRSVVRQGYEPDFSGSARAGGAGRCSTRTCLYGVRAVPAGERRDVPEYVSRLRQHSSESWLAAGPSRCGGAGQSAAGGRCCIVHRLYAHASGARDAHALLRSRGRSRKHRLSKRERHDSRPTGLASFAGPPRFLISTCQPRPRANGSGHGS